MLRDLKGDLEEQVKKEVELEEEEKKDWTEALKRHYGTQERERREEERKIREEWHPNKEEKLIEDTQKRIGRLLSFLERRLLTGAWTARTSEQARRLLEIKTPNWTHLSYENQKAKIRDMLLLNGRWEPINEEEKKRLEHLKKMEKAKSANKEETRRQQEVGEEEKQGRKREKNPTEENK